MKSNNQTNESLIGKAAMLYVKFQIFVFVFLVIGTALVSFLQTN